MGGVIGVMRCRTAWCLMHHAFHHQEDSFFTWKASENKNAILVFAFQTPPHFTHFGWTFAVEFVFSVYHPQDVRDEKFNSSALAHWEHGKRDGFFVRVLSGWHSVGILSEFRWFHGTEPGFLFLHVPSMLRSNWLFHLGGGWSTPEKNSTAKVHPKCIKCWGVWNAKNCNIC